MLPLQRAFLAGLALLASTVVHADLILSGPPSAANVEQINQAYADLAKGLSVWLGEPVRYEAPTNFMGYAQAMREGKYDLLVDGPHFASWRMANLKHQPVVESTEKLVFLTLAKADDERIKSPDDLVNKHVCTQPSPSFGTMLLLAQYPNPMRQPLMKYEEGYAPNVAAMRKGQCDAAVVNSTFYENQMSAADKSAVKVIHTTRPIPGVVLTAGPKLKPAQIDDLRRRLSQPSGDELGVVFMLSQASVRGAKHDSVRWELVKMEQIKGLDELLRSLSWGW